jgi:hypothetical protein
MTAVASGVGGLRDLEPERLPGDGFRWLGWLVCWSSRWLPR